MTKHVLTFFLKDIYAPFFIFSIFAEVDSPYVNFVFLQKLLFFPVAFISVFLFSHLPQESEEIVMWG